MKVVNDVQAQEIRELQKVTNDTLIKLEEIVQTDSKVRELVGLKEAEDEKHLPDQTDKADLVPLKAEPYNP